jgi:hypothetical protein
MNTNSKETETGNQMICYKCQCELQNQKVDFHYLGHYFSNDMLVCPICGQVFVSEVLAKGKMAEVEMLLEDK